MIPLPAWHSDLCVRNPELDAQHITLIEICRELIFVAEFQPNCAELMLVLIQDIAGLTRQHHEMEETILKANGCPTLEAIAAAHLVAQAMIKGLVEDVSQQCVDHGAMVRRITDWTHDHFYVIDMPVRAFLKG
jgi:hemerythrin-like metal-binding protein